MDLATATGHTILDIVGMFPLPVVSSLADAVNAAWYAYEGNYLDAAVTALGIIPGVGDGVVALWKAAKIAIAAAKTSAEAGALLSKFVHGVTGFMYGSGKVSGFAEGTAILGTFLAAAYAWMAKFGKGADGAADGGKKIVLGLMKEGKLEELAKDIGGETWEQFAKGGKLKWQDDFLELMNDKSTKAVFNLDGVKVGEGCQRAATNRGGPTDWELLQIRNNPDW